MRKNVATFIVVIAIFLLLPHTAFAQVSNLIPNPGFEQQLQWWTGPAHAVSTPKIQGSLAAQVQGNATGTQTLESTTISVSAHTRYTFVLPLKYQGLTTCGRYTGFIREFNQEGNLIRTLKTENYNVFCEDAYPRTPERDWYRYRLSFITHPDTRNVKVGLELARITGTFWIDDLSFSADPLEINSTAVTISGKTTPMGMRVEQINRTNDQIDIVTTGARFTVRLGERHIKLYQRIGVSRRLGTISPSLDLTNLAVHSQIDDRVILKNDRFTLAVNGDSTMVIASPDAQRITLLSLPDFTPAYIQQPSANDGHLYAGDAKGGFALFRLPEIGDTNTFQATDFLRQESNYSATYNFAPSQVFVVSVFPPRAFNEPLYKGKQPIFIKNLPTDEQIADWSQWANVVIIFGSGNLYSPKAYEGGPYRVANPVGLRQVVARSHALGTKVILYVTPFFYYTRDPADFVAEMKRLITKSGVDGFYLDGLNAYEIKTSWQIMRQLREFTSLVYVHGTFGPPLSSHKDLPVPFLDTYADYILKGEHRQINSLDDPHLQYVIAQRYVSGSIGMLKYDVVTVPMLSVVNKLVQLGAGIRWTNYNHVPSSSFRFGQPASSYTDQYLPAYYVAKLREQSQPTPTPLPGDINHDGKVDIFD